MASLRARKLAAIEFHRHPTIGGHGRHEYAVIAIPAEKTKNEIAIERRVLEFARDWKECAALLREADAARAGPETRLGQVEHRIAAMIRAIEDGLYQPAMKEHGGARGGEGADHSRTYHRAEREAGGAAPEPAGDLP
jgi:hypothetical protein